MVRVLDVELNLVWRVRLVSSYYELWLWQCVLRQGEGDMLECLLRNIESHIAILHLARNSIYDYMILHTCLNIVENLLQVHYGSLVIRVDAQVWSKLSCCEPLQEAWVVVYKLQEIGITCTNLTCLWNNGYEICKSVACWGEGNFTTIGLQARSVDSYRTCLELLRLWKTELNLSPPSALVPELIEIDVGVIATTYARHRKLARFTVATCLLLVSSIVVRIPIPTWTPLIVNHWVLVTAIAVSDVLNILLAIQFVNVRAISVINLRHHKHEWLTWLEVLVVLCWSSLTSRNLRVVWSALLVLYSTVRVVTCEVVVSNLTLLVTLVSVLVGNHKDSITSDKRCRVNLVVAVQLCRDWSLTVVLEHCDICDTPLDALALELWREVYNNLCTISHSTLYINIVVSIVVWSSELCCKQLAIVVELGVRDSCYNVNGEGLTKVKTVVASESKH